MKEAKMSKITAVEWLWHHFNVAVTKPSEEMLEIALEKEKEQIIDAWSAGKKNPFIVQHSECCENNGKQYYNETYGTK